VACDAGPAKQTRLAMLLVPLQVGNSSMGVIRSPRHELELDKNLVSFDAFWGIWLIVNVRVGNKLGDNNGWMFHIVPLNLLYMSTGDLHLPRDTIVYDTYI
jgi:hypothetical protein